MFHFTDSPLPVTMLNGPKCNLNNFSFLHTLGQGEGRKGNRVQRQRRKHLAHPNTGEGEALARDPSRLRPRTEDGSKGSHPGRRGEPAREMASSHASNISWTKANARPHGQGPPPGSGLQGRPSVWKSERKQGRRAGGRDGSNQPAPSPGTRLLCTLPSQRPRTSFLGWPLPGAPERKDIRGAGTGPSPLSTSPTH